MVRGYTYQLTFLHDPHWMVGSSKQTLANRKALYCFNADSGVKGPVFDLIREHGHDGFRLDVIDHHDYNKISELRWHEQQLLDTYKNDLCLNKNRAINGPGGKWETEKLRRAKPEAKAQKAAAAKRYFSTEAGHANKIKQGRKRWAANKDRINAARRAQRAAAAGA